MSTSDLMICVLIFFVILGIISFLLPDSKEIKTPFQFSALVKKKWKSNVPYTRLVKEIIEYTGSILYENKVKHFPTFDIKYYKVKKFMGLYYGANNHISIYIKNHDNIPSIVDTVLHEVAHHIQNKSRNKEFKLYDTYSNSFGYMDNPLEIESRSFAAKWTKDCLIYLESRKIISKK